MRIWKRNQNQRPHFAYQRSHELLEDRRVLASYSGVVGEIADNTMTAFALNISDSFLIADLNVQLSIQHTRVSDLDVFLVSPSGTRVELFTDVGGNGDNFTNTVLDDEAAQGIGTGAPPYSGQFRPEGVLADFDGVDSTGLWWLEITDDRRRQAGQLESWSVSLTPLGVPPTVSINDISIREQGDTSAFVESGAGGLINPTDMLIGPDGNLYVANGDVADSVLRFDKTTGDFIDTFVQSGSGGLNNPHGIAFGPDGNLYVASGFDSRVLRYDGTTGAFLDEFVPAGSGGLDKPRAIVFRPDGFLYVGSDFTDEVLRFDALSGEFVDVFVSSGAGGLDAPYRMTFGLDNNLYVVSQNTNEVLRFDGATGDFVDTFVTAGSGGLLEPREVIFDDSFLYVSSAGNDKVLRYNADTGEPSGEVPLAGTVEVPRDMLFDTAGNLLISSRDTSEVRRIEQRFDVTLSHASSTEVTVEFTSMDSTATAVEDYTPTAGTLIFSPGETTKSILVPTIDDQLDEETEVFFVEITNASGATIIESVGEATITDDDAATPVNVIYVYDIRFESKRGNKDWRAVFEIRIDSNANGIGDEDDAAASGATIDATFAGPLFEDGTTDSNGVYRTPWSRDLEGGLHYANVLDLALAGFTWDLGLSLLQEDDSDMDSKPDGSLNV